MAGSSASTSETTASADRIFQPDLIQGEFGILSRQCRYRSTLAPRRLLSTPVALLLDPKVPADRMRELHYAELVTRLAVAQPQAARITVKPDESGARSQPQPGAAIVVWVLMPSQDLNLGSPCSALRYGREHAA